MIFIGNTEVFGFRAALHGMRNPMESWSQSDTRFDPADQEEHPVHVQNWLAAGFFVAERPIIGPNDLKLMLKLVAGGSEHQKFLRQITVDCVIEAPRYLWQEIDTYKGATVRDSCSTMHKLGHRELVPDDFYEGDVMAEVLLKLNSLGNLYRKGGMRDYDLVRKMKRYLPEGYLQRADYHMSYETAMAMFRQRHNHRLPEWRWTGGTKIVNGKQSICDWIYSLPYMSSLLTAIMGENDRRAQHAG
jgi:hypothetical protein